MLGLAPLLFLFSLSVSQHTMQECVHYFVTKGCDQILTTPLFNPLMSLEVISVDSSMGSTWTCQALNWSLSIASYIKLISVLAHTMGCHESTAVRLYVYWDKNAEMGWGMMTTSYMYNPLLIFHSLIATLNCSLQQSSAEWDRWWRSCGTGWCSEGEPQLENTDVSNSLGSHDLSWINSCTLNAGVPQSELFSWDLYHVVSQNLSSPIHYHPFTKVTSYL